MSDWQTWGGRAGRALSLRVIVLSLVVGVCAGVLVGMAYPGATMPVAWTVAGLCYLMAVMNDGQMVKCDACGKRVKLGSERCHHCGYSRA